MKMKYIWVLLWSLFLSACGGDDGDGGGEAAKPSSSSATLIYRSSNQGRALINVNGLRETRLTVENTSSDRLDITAETSGLAVGFSVSNNQCQGAELATSDTCQITVQYLRDENSQGSITVSGVAQSDGRRTVLDLPVFGIKDPFDAITDQYIGHINTSDFCNAIGLSLMGCDLYKLGEVTSPASGAWHSGASAYTFAFNGPLVQTYYPDPFLFMTPLVTRRSCAAGEFYYVAQYGSTTSGAINPSNSQDNVFIKYHPLMSDGETNGVTGHTVNFSGRLNLTTSENSQFMDHIVQSAHDSIWSGPSNVPELQQLLNTNTNAYVTSSFQNTSSGQTVYAVNSLLNRDYLRALLVYLQSNPSPHEIDNSVDAPDLQEPVFQDSVRQYRQTVAQHCLTGFN
ncbi:hypothetical protein ACFFUP_04970 [Vibrio ostreicida]|uniref:Uncharacterized protein n=1 Tax=Vibrio ostreicida TaxID=526588 RepID=A0ABT8C0X4_9VIBR|nr:hypothetical protein [Vibrio ostreicida]MDN3611900.1 hypothetical protein [Vibrio ostreicida]NPD08917.1 hypothetical protein [Vibrio ostreicida]